MKDIQPQIDDNPDQILSIFQEMKNNFKQHKTLDIKHRKQSLKNLLDSYQKMIPQFDDALKKDLGYNTFMANFLAHQITMGQIKEQLNGLDKWVKSQSVQTPIALGLASSQIQYQPLGLVLVLSAWNYPIYTAIPQVAAGIAAGNSVILKPSQMAPYTSKVIRKMFEKYMDPKYYRVIQGKVQVAKALTKLPFDLICFTGSSTTGRLVAIEAAKNLTPCILQLGGKCPAIVDQSANIQSAVLRILFGKFANCGQTCVGVDHVFIHESIKQKFKKVLLIKIKQMYGNQNLAEQGNYGKIINDYHVKRLSNLLNQEHGGKLLYGGQVDSKNQFIEPTIIETPKKDSLLMKQQIFGPILPIIYYTDLNAVITQLNSRAKPLTIYLFSQNDKNIKNVRKNTFSGTFVVNDALLHMVNTNLPFGGVGSSGYGRWSGKSGFVSFSNKKSVCTTKAVNIYPLSQRFPPYTESKKKTMSFLLKVGNITYSQLGKSLLLFLVIATLGGAVYQLRSNL